MLVKGSFVKGSLAKGSLVKGAPFTLLQNASLRGLIITRNAELHFAAGPWQPSILLRARWDLSLLRA